MVKYAVSLIMLCKTHANDAPLRFMLFEYFMVVVIVLIMLYSQLR